MNFYDFLPNLEKVYPPRPLGDDCQKEPLPIMVIITT